MIYQYIVENKCSHTIYAEYGMTYSCAKKRREESKMFEVCVVMLAIGIGGAFGLLVLLLERVIPGKWVDAILRRMGVEDEK